jgi:hypothetical protein
MSIFHSSLAVCMLGAIGALAGLLGDAPDQGLDPKLAQVIGGEFADPEPIEPVPATYLKCVNAGINCFEYQARHGTCGNAKTQCGPCASDASGCLAGPCSNEQNVKGCAEVEIRSSCDPLGGGVILCGTALQGSCIVTVTDTGIVCAYNYTTTPPTAINTYLCTGGSCNAGTGTTPCSAVNCK